MIDAYASEPHYRDHIAPVFDALGGQRGEWRRHGANPVIVASYKDLLGVGQRPVIFMEHGAGQTYGDGHPSYAGGRGREGVRLFLCPSERVAELNRARYPTTPAVVVGCPKLDALLDLSPEPGTVGFAWHWNAQVCPESRSALRHYAGGLEAIARRVPTVGTAHPRIAAAAEKIYTDAGIARVDAAEMFARAEVLVVDNSSIGWEFIALNRPVVWANAPWYRRDVDHGLRFWEDADIMVDGPHQLEDAIAVAREDPPAHRQRRQVSADAIYGSRDGRSTTRAVAAISEHIGG